MQDVDVMARGGTATTDNMNGVMNDFCCTNQGTVSVSVYKGLSGILDTIIGTTSTVLIIFNEASSAIPDLFVQLLVCECSHFVDGRPGKPDIHVLQSCQLTNIRKPVLNLDDMRQVATVTGESVVPLL